MDGVAWWAAVHGVAQSRTRLKWLGSIAKDIYYFGANFKKIIYTRLHNLREKAVAPHSSTLGWKIPWMEEPGGLPSMGSHRVRHDWSDLAAAAAAHNLSRSKSRHSYSFVKHLEHKRKARNKPNRPSIYQNSYHERQIPKLIPFSPEVDPSNSLKSVHFDVSYSFSSLFYLFFLDYRYQYQHMGCRGENGWR